MTLDEAVAVSAERFLSDSELDALCSNGAELDAVALAIAKQYVGGKMTFEVSDKLMNSLWGYACRRCKEEAFPKAMYAVFMAFDAGEYHRQGDAEGVDPEMQYTKPELLRILSKL